MTRNTAAGGDNAAALEGRATVVLVLGILLIGLNLRPLFSSTSVVLPEILSTMGLSPFAGGVLTTLPVLCLGLFAPLAVRLSARWSIERTMLGVIVAIAIGSALRGLTTASPLFIGTLIAGAGIAVGNVLMPALLKRDFPHRVKTMTGFHTMALCGGGAMGAGLTVPIEQALGGKLGAALALWALPALLAAIVWLPQCASARLHRDSADMTPVTNLHRDPVAWHVTLFMGLQSLFAYAVMGWLAPILRWRGVDPALAGAMVSVSMLVQAAAALVTPVLIARSTTQSLANAGSGMLATITLLLILFGPTGWLWPGVVVLGISQGALFTLGVTMILLRSPDARVAASLSGMAQGIGYTVASAGPFIIGIVRGATGGFEVTALMYIVVGLAISGFGWQAGQHRFVRTGDSKRNLQDDAQRPAIE